MLRSTNSIESGAVRAISTIVRRVMPSRLSAVDGGETIWPRRSRNTCSALPSLTSPDSVRKIASSKPLRFASARASAEFR